MDDAPGPNDPMSATVQMSRHRFVLTVKRIWTVRNLALFGVRLDVVTDQEKSEVEKLLSLVCEIKLSGTKRDTSTTRNSNVDRILANLELYYSNYRTKKFD